MSSTNSDTSGSVTTISTCSKLISSWLAFPIFLTLSRVLFYDCFLSSSQISECVMKLSISMLHIRSNIILRFTAFVVEFICIVFFTKKYQPSLVKFVAWLLVEKCSGGSKTFYWSICRAEQCYLDYCYCGSFFFGCTLILTATLFIINTSLAVVAFKSLFTTGFCSQSLQ